LPAVCEKGRGSRRQSWRRKRKHETLNLLCIYIPQAENDCITGASPLPPVTEVKPAQEEEFSPPPPGWGGPWALLPEAPVVPWTVITAFSQ